MAVQNMYETMTSLSRIFKSRNLINDEDEFSGIYIKYLRLFLDNSWTTA